MGKSRNAREQAVLALMAEKSHWLTRAQALGDLGMEELARPLWLETAGREEQIAPLLEAMGRQQEAAVHRLSAASCYEKGNDYARAANLYQATLAGPLLEATRREVQEMLQRCLTSLVREAVPPKLTSSRRPGAGTVPTQGTKKVTGQ